MRKLFIGLFLFSVLGSSYAKQITIAVSVTPLSTPIIIADDQGFFSRQGLDVRLDEYIDGMRTARAMLESKADFATSSEAVVMFNSFKQNNFAIVSTFVESDNDVKILTTKKSSIKAVSDLAKARIGTIIGTSAHYFIEHTLLMNGVDTRTVDIVKINPEDTSNCLLNGDVDVAVSWEPFIFMANTELGKDTVIIDHDRIYTKTFNLIVNKKFANQNPDVIRKMLKSLQQATEFIYKNQSRSQKIVAERFNKDRQVIDSVWSDLNFSLSLHQSLIMTLESQGRWAIYRDLVQADNIPNYLDFIMIEPLKTVQPSAVTVIH